MSPPPGDEEERTSVTALPGVPSPNLFGFRGLHGLAHVKRPTGEVDKKTGLKGQDLNPSDFYHLATLPPIHFESSTCMGGQWRWVGGGGGRGREEDDGVGSGSGVLKSSAHPHST